MNIFSKMRISTKVTLGYCLVIMLMCVISAVIYRGVSSIVDASKWVNHTYEVIRIAESVSAAMVDMETGQRGFLVTGQDEYLEPYFSGEKRSLELINKGKHLTSDNPEQGVRWDELKKLRSNWIKEVAETEIETRRKVEQGFESVENFKKISSRTVGKMIFDDIRRILQGLDDKFSAINNTSGSQLITLITLDLVNMETGQRGFLLTGKEESLEPYVAGQKSLDKHLNQATRIIRGTNVTQRDINQLSERINDWIKEAADPEINARRDVNNYPLAMTDIKKMMWEGNGKIYMDTIRGVIKDIVDAEEILIAKRSENQKSSSQFVILTTIIGTIIAILFSIVIAVIVTRSIATPIALINNRLKEVINGDLTKRIEINVHDELGQLSAYINSFLDGLQVTIQEILEAAKQLASSTSQVKTAATKSSQELDEQSNETAQVATAINQMARAIEEVARSTENANGSASQANQRAIEGNTLVQETLDSIKELTSDVDSSSTVLNELKAHSANIGTVLDVIRNIAEQTNLLALNAAIEAARAGEQGRGFAVVADEVRTLAKRTQDSTSEIQTIITDLQSGSEQAVLVMEKSRSKSCDTLEKAEKTGQFLSSITEAISKVLDMNTQISSAAQEQAAVTHDVNRSVVNIESISKSTVVGAQETEKLSDEVSELSKELRNLVAKFNV